MSQLILIFLFYETFKSFVGFINPGHIFFFRLLVKSLYQFGIIFPVRVVDFVDRTVVKYNNFIDHSHCLHLFATEGLHEINTITDHLGR